MIDSIWSRIEESRSRCNVLEHPFYQRWSAGELSAADLVAYSGQYRHAVTAIATLSEAAAAAAPQHRELAEHATEEAAHIRLWDGFLSEVDGDESAASNPETAECVDAWVGGEDESLVLKLAALYAIESGQPEISRTKLEGLRDHYGVANARGTTYFTVHQSRDLEHAEQARELIEQVASLDDADAIVARAEAVFDANWRLLDGVC